MNSKIFVKIDRTRTHSGESKCTNVEVTLSSELIDYWVYIDFMKPDGSKFKTPRLDIINNVVSYDLPLFLLDQKGCIQIQVVLENHEQIILKSGIIKHKIYESINAEDDIPNKESFVSVVQKSLDEMNSLTNEMNNLTNEMNVLSKDLSQLNKEVQNGLTPTIGENENWFICGKDTGKPSRGRNGDPGKDGVDGKDYVITNDDYNSIANVVKDNIQPIIDEIHDTSESAISIAKGANQSLVYNNYSELITVFNSLNNEVYKVGQNVLIVTLNVPDLWISEISNDINQFIYVSDNDLISKLNESGYIQIGYYRLSALETQKVDLTAYATKEDLSEFITEENLTDYATKDNLTAYTTKEEFDSVIGDSSLLLDDINGEVI